MKKIISIAVLSLCFSPLAFAVSAETAAESLPQLTFSLKAREPNWRVEVVKSYPNGSPQVILFYQPLLDGTEKAVKEVFFHENGRIQTEMDIVIVDEGSPVAKEWGSTIVAHGMRVDFNQEGQLVKAASFERGLFQGEIRFFSPEGKVLLSQFFANGKPQGRAMAFYENGTLKEDATYSNGELDGDLIQYYETGVKALVLPHKNGKANGLSTEWFPSGAVRAERQFSNGQLSGDGKNPAVILYDEEHRVREVADFREGKSFGLHTRYHENGKEIYRVQYKNGVKVGKELYFGEDGALLGQGVFDLGAPQGKHWRNHPNGALASLAEYDSQGRLLGPITEFDENGQKIREYSVQNEKLEGLYTEWHPDGQLKCEYNYALGKYEGEQKECYPSGEIKVRTSYHNEKRNGIHEEWHDNGVLSRKIHFIDGLKEGSSAEWFSNGVSKLDAYFQADHPDGVQSEWFDNGQIKARIEYSFGLKQGWHREWNEKGGLLFEACYNHDAVEGPLLTWWDSGQIRSRLNFENGLKEGPQQWFHQNGQLERVATFHRDMNEGDLTAWYNDGSIQSVQHFHDGKPIGEHREYFPPSNADQQDEERLARNVHYDEESKLHGAETNFYPDGKTQGIVFYDHGKLEGMKKLWDAQGNLLEEANYVQGKLNGRFFQKMPDGREIVFTYRNNFKNGPHEVYYPPVQNGRKIKAVEANFENDQLQGLVVEYTDRGVKVAETPYEQGVKEGRAKVHGADGKVVTAVDWVNNQQEGFVIQYFPTGAIARETPYLANKKEGDEKTYHENGSLASVVHYHNDGLDGLSQSWNLEGILVFEAEYKEGQRHGFFRKYYDTGKPYISQAFLLDKPHGEKRKYDRDGNVAIYTQTH